VGYLVMGHYAYDVIVHSQRNREEPGNVMFAASYVMETPVGIVCINNLRQYETIKNNCC
jgi:hypothetical protein